jgi:hypothetical protein
VRVARMLPVQYMTKSIARTGMGGRRDPLTGLYLPCRGRVLIVSHLILNHASKILKSCGAPFAR